MKPQAQACIIVGLCFMAGLSMAAGYKTADWLIPDPPRPPLQFKIAPIYNSDPITPHQPEERSST